ncbi:MAG: hypothetical protein HUK21_03595 [Fibrobacteraceae bacterium]|nr:hypothetical protein [Fibrobacteraceae bacterium]
MKKIATVFLAAALFCLMGCEEKGTIQGKVLDPFTGKVVELPTVWLDSTIYGTQSPKYKYRDMLKEGKFQFDKVPPGKYHIESKRSKYVLTQSYIETTAENPNLDLTLYIYSDQVLPGLYNGSAEGPVKIANEWVIWSTQCSQSVGYRLNFPQVTEKAQLPPNAKKKDKKAKKGKKGKDAEETKMTPLPAPREMPAEIDVFYVNASSVTSPLVVKSYPAVEGPVSAHKDCKGFDEDKTGLFADMSKGTELKAEYRAESLYEIKGTLPKGKQILQLSQDGKTLQTYYFEVK